jgi:putative transposase
MKPGMCRLVGLRGYSNDMPPAQLEATFYATKRTGQPLVEIQ